MKFCKPHYFCEHPQSMMHLFSSTVLFALTFYYSTVLNYSSAQKNNVCRKLRDYFNIDFNQNCWYDPTVPMNLTEIVRFYGYGVQNFSLPTEDGYVLGVFRIQYNGTNNHKNRIPILLQHGLGTQGDSWFFIGNKSLPLVLFQMGFDIWIGNSRGTQYSKQHLKYSPKSKEFWNFTFHEMGKYDLSAVVNFIANVTGQKVHIVGHSLGSAQCFVYASMSKDHNTNGNLASIIGLGPSIYYSHAKSPLLWTLLPYRDMIMEFFNSLDIYALDLEENFLQEFSAQICALVDFLPYCSMFIGRTSGFQPQEFQPEVLPHVIQKVPYGVPIKVLIHVCQIAIFDRFQNYDYGPLINKQIYNSTASPIYNLSHITVPVHLFYGNNDLLADKSDVERLYDELTSVKMKSIVHLLNDSIPFSHGDFVFGRHSREVAHEIFKAINASNNST